MVSSPLAHSVLVMTSRPTLIFMFFLLLSSAEPRAQTLADFVPEAAVSTDFIWHTSRCPPLPLSGGNNIHVYPDQVSRLQSIIDSAEAGDSILLEDGVYHLQGHYLWLGTPGISIRSASGNPRAVVLDGGYKSRQIMTVAASNISIAEFTIRRAFTHPLHIISSDRGDTENTQVYRMIIQDPREQAIKINPHKPGLFVDNGTVSCSLIEMSEQGRRMVNPIAGGCYTGGIDAHQASDWKIHDNRIQGFWCPEGLSEHAIHFWKGSRNTLVERNLLFDNARGIGFGLKSRGISRPYANDICATETGTYVGHYGGVVRNNMIHASAQGLFASAAGFDCGICLWSSCNTVVVHNTIASTGPLFSAIEWRFPASRDIHILNNLSTHGFRQRNGANAYLEGNLKFVDLSLFVDAPKGDLHLSQQAKSVIDRGVPISGGLAERDIDLSWRDAYPDIGADER